MANRSIEFKTRGKGKVKTKAVYLFLAEGKNKTETLYFNNFQSQENDYVIRFAKAGNRTDATSLYDCMLEKWREWELSAEKGDRGFIVLDIDNSPQKVETVAKLVANNNNSAIEFIVSNPTFEVWFLLHFKYTTKYFADGEAVIRELKRYIPDYEKSKDYYDICSCKIQDALSSANKLERQYKEVEWPSLMCNPRTDVGKVVSFLVEALNNSRK